jgi:hypothetical protein
VHHGQTGGSKQTVSTRHGKQTASTRHGKQTATSRRGGTHTAKHGGAKGGKKSATTQRRAGKTGTTQRRAGKTVTTQRRAETKNVRQASTSKRVSVSSQQRTRIRQVVVTRNLVSRLRVTNVSFAIRIGVLVPRTFHLFVIPEEIVIIVPRFRHLRAFIFDSELVIVDPVTFTIVAIIPI